MDLLAELEILAVTANNEDNSIILETASTNQYYNHTTQPPTALRPRDKNSTFLVKLEGPLSSPFQVQELSKSVTTPILKAGVGETSTANFCLISGAMKLNIVSALAGSTFSATFVRINLSPKDLSPHSIAPCLGSDIEPTLPQNRATNADEVFLPKQSQYPVWYFFYGDLTVPEILYERLGLDERPVYRKAALKNGTLKTWGGGKYKALIDGNASARVEGWAYEVGSEEDEEMLRYYGTDCYEVVRCDISMVDDEEVVRGLVFRLMGDVD
ncbi:gamma-glutamylcyclotransferase family protein [Aspergillus vadensis CBS 113365]|uniref:Putative gamma-glutamylcyclotransferase n=1 Tax=Aspergillus vadensis (strain CBS 113365 / IMI 142717 / IBT 24658) TaxID=1448311 RepID=A0A319B447_ASPVC|nr:hypothetical protein BO88DRAFT_343584 [Aspergillus vadensis CBS 113365]PYH67556.1 hypothetical protein BO88DRAFT_343584 [Aspergillus vadensis CBS 113365]